MKHGFYYGIFIVTLLGLMNLWACKHTRYAVNGHQQKMQRIQYDSLQVLDSSVYRFILPYKLKMDAEINEVVGSTETTLLREKPEGTLGNLAADAVLFSAKANSNRPVDLCVLNAGGLRIASIGAGKITVGKMFELMPFENEVVVLELKGEQVRALFKLIGENEGWPISGARCVLKGREVIEMTIGGVPLQNDRTYTLATSDYLANGGDMASCLLQPLSRKALKLKIRDVISAYVKGHSPLKMEKEGRITKTP